jgi:hypothetical protein
MSKLFSISLRALRIIHLSKKHQRLLAGIKTDGYYLGGDPKLASHRRHSS